MNWLANSFGITEQFYLWILLVHQTNFLCIPFVCLIIKIYANFICCIVFMMSSFMSFKWDFYICLFPVVWGTSFIFEVSNFGSNKFAHERFLLSSTSLFSKLILLDVNAIWLEEIGLILLCDFDIILFLYPLKLSNWLKAILYLSFDSILSWLLNFTFFLPWLVRQRSLCIFNKLQSSLSVNSFWFTVQEIFEFYYNL